EGLPDGVEVFRIDGPFFFGVAGELLDTLRTLGQKPRVVILRLRRVPFLDASCATALEEFGRQARGAGVRVIFSGVQPPAMAVLAAAGLGTDSRLVEHTPDYPSALERAKT